MADTALAYAAAPRAHRSRNRRSLALHAWIGLFSILALIGGLGGWAAVTNIAGAVVAGGLVVVEGGSQRVQHQEGGIVAEILVRNEDTVSAGQLLVRLDGTTTQANLEVVVSQLREAFARQSRLLAESTGATAMVPPPMARDWPADPELDALYAAQDKLRLSRASGIKGQQSRLDEQIAQLSVQIDGYQAQRDAIESQLAITAAEAKDVEDLYAKNLVQLTRVNALRRSQAELEGQLGSIDAQMAGVRAAIAEREVAREQVSDDFQSQVLTDLQAVTQQIAEGLQQKIAAEDRLRRLEIRAPVSGVVHESVIQTVGGVVAAGETLMLIVPKDTHLLVDARVSPLDIDKLYVDQPVVVRMASLDVRTTPELDGHIKSISPDLTRDAITGVQYYLVRVDVADDELKKLPQGTKLVPGMPAETFIQTGERTVWAYLTHPITEQLNRIFRED